MNAETLQYPQIGHARLAPALVTLIGLLLILSGFVDVPSLVETGPFSGGAIVTLFEAAVAVFLVLSLGTYPRRLVYVLAPYSVFLFWASLTALWEPPNFGGVQNWIVYVSFGLIMLSTGALAARNPGAMTRTIDIGVRWLERIALVIAALCLVLQGLPGDENPWLMGPRSFALVGLLPLSWHVAQWNTGRHRSGLFAWVWITAIGLSLSRTATAVGLMFIMVAFLLQLRWNVRALLIRVPVIIVAMIVTVTGLALGTPMGDRFFTGDTSIEVGGLSVNASGRMNIWPLVIESAWNAPVAGQGLGSSMRVARTIDGIGHPHNDYLRIWHDLGFIGLAIFCFAFAVMIVALVRNWRRSAARGSSSVPIHLAALLSLIGILITCTTDNAIIYPFVMTPLAVLIGAALGSDLYSDLDDGFMRGELPVAKLTVVLVHNRYQQAGGEDEVFAAEGELLESRGHRVERITVDNHDLADQSRVSMAMATVWNKEIYTRVREICRRSRADVAHFHNTFPMISPAAYYAAHAEDVAVVQTLHNFRLICPKAVCFRDGRPCEDCVGKPVPWPGVVHRCYRESLSASAVTVMMLTMHRAVRTWHREIDVYVALSHFARQKFIAGGLPPARLVVKPNFLTSAPGPGDHGGNYALFVGRLSAEKGLELLMRAWPAMAGRMPLKVVGSGPLESLVRDRGEGIEWLGLLPRERVIELMQNASFLVFPSEVYENCPMTILQAFATGLPVVASGHGSIAEIVEDGVTGLHFRPGDLADLVRVLTWAVDHPEALAGMRAPALKMFSDEYTADHNYQLLSGVYEAAVRQQRAAA